MGRFRGEEMRMGAGLAQECAVRDVVRVDGPLVLVVDHKVHRAVRAPRAAHQCARSPATDQVVCDPASASRRRHARDELDRGVELDERGQRAVAVLCQAVVVQTNVSSATEKR